LTSLTWFDTDFFFNKRELVSENVYKDNAEGRNTIMTTSNFFKKKVNVGEEGSRTINYVIDESLKITFWNLRWEPLVYPTMKKKIKLHQKIIEKRTMLAVFGFLKYDHLFQKPSEFYRCEYLWWVHDYEGFFFIFCYVV